MSTSTCSTPIPTVFGPTESTLRELRGIRLFSDEHGAGGAGDGGQGGDGQQQDQQGGGGNAGGQQGQQQGQQGQQPRPTNREATPYERTLREEAMGYRKDRDKAASDLAAANAEREELRAWKIQREQSDAIRAAAGTKGNATLLIDSGRFREDATKAKLDWSDAAAVKAFTEKFVDDHPEYGQTAGLPSSGGPGAHGGATEISLQEQLAAAEKDGRSTDVIALKRRIAASNASTR